MSERYRVVAMICWRLWWLPAVLWAFPASGESGHWAFAPESVGAVPAKEEDRWSRHALDAFVQRNLRERELAPNRRASPAVLLRRLRLDLRGLPVSLMEQEAFAG